MTVRVRPRVLKNYAQIIDPENFVVPNTMFGFDGVYLEAQQFESGQGY